MKVSEITPRAFCVILPGAGMGEGRNGFIRGFNSLYGTVKVGLVDEQGNYTGDSIPVHPNYIKLTGGSHTYT